MEILCATYIISWSGKILIGKWGVLFPVERGLKWSGVYWTLCESECAPLWARLGLWVQGFIFSTSKYVWEKDVFETGDKSAKVTSGSCVDFPSFPTNLGPTYFCCPCNNGNLIPHNNSIVWPDTQCDIVGAESDQDSGDLVSNSYLTMETYSRVAIVKYSKATPWASHKDVLYKALRILTKTIRTATNSRWLDNT